MLRAFLYPPTAMPLYSLPTTDLPLTTTAEQAAAEDPLSLGGGYDYNWVLWSISKIRTELGLDADVEVRTTYYATYYLLPPTCYLPTLRLLLTTILTACYLLLTACYVLLATYHLLPATYLLLAIYCSQADLNAEGKSFPGFPTTLYELLYGKEEGT